MIWCSIHHILHVVIRKYNPAKWQWDRMGFAILNIVLREGVWGVAVWGESYRSQGSKPCGYLWGDRFPCEDSKEAPRRCVSKRNACLLSHPLTHALATSQQSFVTRLLHMLFPLFDMPSTLSSLLGKLLLILQNPYLNHLSVGFPDR